MDKERLIAKGFTQQLGIDYGKLLSTPVNNVGVKFKSDTSMRMILLEQCCQIAAIAL